MATAKKDVAVATPSAVGFSQEVPSYINKDSNRGSEEVSSKDLILPRLEIVQALSPIKEVNQDAREGHLFNSATQEVYGDTVYVVPVYFRVEYLIWKDQNEGGGFFGSFPTQAEAERRKAEVVAEGEDADLLEIVDTPVHFCLMVKPDDMSFAQQIVISMAKTKAKVSRKWNSLVQIVGGDRFSRVYKVTTFTDENKKGQKFKNFVVSPAGFAPEPLYRIAEKTYEVFKTQNVSADHASVVNSDEFPNNGNDPIDRGEV